MNEEEQKKWIRREVGGGVGGSVEKSQSHNFVCFCWPLIENPKF